ncbi:hypothetical protein [Mesorhizobium sp.]|uniref:hypothetical protein n=1 Tax=Mesorhizobium sp. TaxID=1871066 RepID=UPI001201D181|nr:hypothetical protein [Mesorhizobium sp.]TIL50467.1 MAG: hypothetical protein E5Y83_21850 [Mesorhizobium sp.]
MTVDEIRKALGQMRSILIAVATGGPRIGEVNHEYEQTYEDVNSNLRMLGVENSVPYRDLWQWYGRWSSGDLPTYQSRRVHIAELIDPLVESLQFSGHQKEVIPPPEPTGWARVDRTVGRARRDLAEARNEEEFQAVGMLCREALISLAQAVYSADKHPVADVATLSPTDFKRMIEAFVAVELAGGSSEDLRRHARAAFDLANNLQHRRTADFRLAAMCMEATASIINIVAIVSGRRDPS